MQKAKPVNRAQAKLLLRQAYQTSFGIFDYFRQAHIDDNAIDPSIKRPLASVALHPAEDWSQMTTEFDRVVRGFSDNNIGETFKISLLEFLELPIEHAARLMRLGKETLRRKQSLQPMDVDKFMREMKERR